MEKSEPSSPGFPSETSILLLGPTAADTGLSRTNVTNAAAFSSMAQTHERSRLAGEASPAASSASIPIPLT